MLLRRLLTSLLISFLVFATTGGALAQDGGPVQPQAGESVTALPGTGFTYQGDLRNGGSPVTGTCDFQFSLFDALSGGAQQGSTQTVTSVGVANERFTVTLNAAGQFGARAFDGSARWLASAVRCPAGGGGYTSLTPRQPLTAAPLAFALPGLRTEQNATSPNVIGGHISNTVGVGVVGATISGGGGQFTFDLATADSGAGSAGGNIGSGFSTIYFPNSVTANYGTIGGGTDNTASNDWATVSGGFLNTASGEIATVGGGYGNTASNQNATVAGGNSNIASGIGAFVGGGGYTGIIINGVFGNEASGNGSAIGGGLGNIASGPGAFIGGGGYDGSNQYSNTASGAASVIGGGMANTASGEEATIAGGDRNVASGAGAFIGGGGWSGSLAAGNTASGAASVVGGGLGNVASGTGAFVGGGGWNGAVAGNTAAAIASTIAGGYANVMTTTAAYGTIGGGESNLVSGPWATVPGGRGNTAAGNYSFAAGYGSHANHAGTFVWTCGANCSDIYTSAGEQFLASAEGGFWFGGRGTGSDSGPSGAIISTQFISTTTGAYLSTVGVWTDVSDRNAKTNFAPVSVLEALMTLPVESWQYKLDDAHVRHIGPTAQDFYAVFGVGQDNTHLAALDTSGVALAAIQGLYTVVQAKDAEIAALQAEQAATNARLAALESATALENDGGTTAPAPLTAALPWLLLAGLALLNVGGLAGYALAKRAGRRA